MIVNNKIIIIYNFLFICKTNYIVNQKVNDIYLIALKYFLKHAKMDVMD